MRGAYRFLGFGCAAAVAALLVSLVGGRGAPSFASAAQLSPSAGGGLVTHVQNQEGGLTRVIIVDPLQRVMAIYDVGPSNGDIRLKSVRNLNGDLQLQEYNSGDPSPMDIQKQLQRQ